MKQLFQLIALSLICAFASPAQAQDLHRKNGDLPCLHKNFNIAVHVAVDSLNRDPIAAEPLINKMLEDASSYFQPICVSFTACEISIIEDNYAYANLQDAPIPVEQRIQKMEALFAKDERINVFVVDSIQNIECGYGRLNGILTPDGATAVIELNNCPDQDNGKNLAHQLGHLFGLFDTYNLDEEIELFDGSNCATAGDLICDTPGDPYGKLIPVFGEPGTFITGNYLSECEFIFSGTDANDDYWQPDVGNIMSAYPCKCGFTREQYFKMVEVYNSSEVKQY